MAKPRISKNMKRPKSLHRLTEASRWLEAVAELPDTGVVVDYTSSTPEPRSSRNSRQKR